MNGAPSPSPLPSWLAPALVGLLGLQLGLSYLQGRMLHGQSQELRAIREELQAIGESLDQGQSGSGQEYGEEESLAPARHRAPRLRPVLRIQEDDAIRKELEASRDSAQKAVELARDTQQKLSWEENARKAEEARKRRAAERDWTPLLVGGLAVGLLAILVRSWLRRRG